MTVNDEKYDPKIGDNVIIWEYNVKAKSFSDATSHFNNIVYPVLAKDKYSRDSYLIAYQIANMLVGITMLGGDPGESDAVIEKLKEVEKFLTKPAKSKTYKLIALNNE
jgi:hypothetical protein